MNTFATTTKLAMEKIAPAVSMRQQRFMGAELRRAREGKATVTDMSVKKLREHASIPKKKRGKLPEVVKPKKASIIKHAMYGHEMAFQRRVRAQSPAGVGHPKTINVQEKLEGAITPKPAILKGWIKQIVDVKR